ncbi:hypothetical protein G6F35_016835 [Rhizopus arrhizus]|nr:hypothetical protein G6F35_016835 [Rhizopus arrhizus]
MTSLNPVLTLGDQIGEALRLHRGASARAARARAIELLDLVRVPEPQRRVDDYPHLLSGGQRQRAMIAAAIACQPALLVADEPTTALDVTVQAQILQLLDDLRRAMGGPRRRDGARREGRRRARGDAARPAAPPLHPGPARGVAAPGRRDPLQHVAAA